MEFAVILVIYNRFAGSCEAGKALSVCAPAGTRVLLCDNSEQDYGNREFCAAHGWNYLGEGKNLGLSKAYNACIRRLQRERFAGMVCLFDDDTRLIPDYFRAVETAAFAKPACSIFFPLLRAGGRIVSPQIIYPNQHAAFFGSPAECLDYAGPCLFAFNSGMAVRSGVFDRVDYDEALFLDGVDYAFLRACYQAGFRSAPVEIIMEHGFSGAERPDFDAALRRFEHYARDHSLVLRDNPGGYRYLVGKRALHLTLRYRNTDFLRVFRRFRPDGNPVIE